MRRSVPWFRQQARQTTEQRQRRNHRTEPEHPIYITQRDFVLPGGNFHRLKSVIGAQKGNGLAIRDKQLSNDDRGRWIDFYSMTVKGSAE